LPGIYKRTILRFCCVRQEITGIRTSYGNAGLIQREAIHVHTFSRQLIELIKMLRTRRRYSVIAWPAASRYQHALRQVTGVFCNSFSVQKNRKRSGRLLIEALVPSDKTRKMINGCRVEDLIRREVLDRNAIELKINSRRP